MTTTPKPEPASDAEIAGIEPNIAKTDWQTCSNCDAGLRSINTPPYLIGTHEDYCILTMWPKVKARIESDREEIARLEKIEAAAVQFIGFYHADEDWNAVLWALGILSELVAPGEMAKTRALADQPKPEPGR